MLGGVELDGKVLIDGCPVWNTSQVWSDGGDATDWNSSGRELTKAFDGNDATHAFATSPANTTIKFIPSISGPFRIYTSMGAASPSTEIATYTLDTGEVETSVAPDGSPEWIDFGTVSNVNSLTLNGTGGSVDTGINLYKIELDGEILVDGGSFGANGFHLPFDPAATGENYSSGQNTNVNFPEKLFDGDLSEAATVSSGGANDSYSIKLPVAITAKTGVDIYVEGNANGEGVRQLKNNGTVVSSLNATTTEGWQSFPNSAVTFDEITSSRTASSYGGGNNGIRVDGELLVDHNNIGVDASGQDNHFADQNFVLSGQGQDTVLDTPMDNYAVLETGKNGNLVATGTGQILGTVKGNNWYCEITPTAGTSNSDGNNVMHIQVFDQGDSEVLVWRSDTGDTYTVGDVVGIAIKDNSYQWYKNGSPVNEVGSGSTVPGQGSITGTSFTAAFLNGGAANAEAAYNFGQQPFAYDPPAGYEGLYQTWEQWARTALGYALDRIAKLEQQRASDIETIAELRTQVESALARIGSIESDEVNDDAVDTVLLTTVADLITRVEALEAE